MEIKNDDCQICYIKLDETKVILDCKHEYHYDCIYHAYKHSKNRRNRECPYCRNYGDWLYLKDGYQPLKYVCTSIEICVCKKGGK